MPAKALGPLVAALPLAPTDLRINQRLATLHTRAGRFTEAALCCRTLQSIYSEADHPEEAMRYGELAERYEERTTTSEPSPANEQAPIFLVAPAPKAAETEAAVPEFEIEEASAEVAAPAPEPEAEQPVAVKAASPWPTTPPAAEFAVAEESAEPTAAATEEIDLSSE